MNQVIVYCLVNVVNAGRLNFGCLDRCVYHESGSDLDLLRGDSVHNFTIEVDRKASIEKDKPPIRAVPEHEVTVKVSHLLSALQPKRTCLREEVISAELHRSGGHAGKECPILQ